jgi:hypothetical protein
MDAPAVHPQLAEKGRGEFARVFGRRVVGRGRRELADVGVMVAWAPVLNEPSLDRTFIFNSAWKAQIETVRETRVGRLASKGTAMLKKYAAMGLGALIALAPLAVLPQAAQAATETPMVHSGSHKSHVRHKSGMSKHHARSSAHHMHKMMHKKPTAPKS